MDARGDSFRDRYGAGPLHPIAAVASFAIATYAFLEIFQRPSPLGFLLWFAGAIVAHDLIAFPLYSLLNRIASGVPSRGEDARSGWGINYVRVPAILSALAFLVWFPLILGLSSNGFEAASGKSTGPYLDRWLLLTAALFAISGVLFAIRSRRAPGRDRPKDPRGAHSRR